MNFTKLIKRICAGAIVGACLLSTACENGYLKFEAGSQNNNGSGNGSGGGNNTTTSIPATAAEANAGLITEGGTVTSEKTGIDFTNYASGDFSIKVRNNTVRRLIAFFGNPREENLISGIPAGAGPHGLCNKTGLFNTSKDFVLFLVTEEDYIANKDDLTALDNMPFTRLYAFYNSNSAENNMVYEISKYMGGTCSLTVNNANRPYNVELRRNGVNGETIGYAAANTVNTTFKVNAGDYYIFPVFRKFDYTINEIVTVYPKRANGKAVVEVLPLDEENPSATINSNNWGTVTFSPSASYIKVVNNSSKGLSVYNGAQGSELMTSTGSKLIAAGKSKVFQVNMDLTGGSSTVNPVYAEYTEYAQYCVGNATTDKIYIINNGATVPTSTFKFYAGKMYTVNVFDDENQDFRVDASWKDASTDISFE